MNPVDWIRKLSEEFGYTDGLRRLPKIRVTDRLTYKDDDISGYASSRLVTTKI